jgi:hypothetical protein
VFKISVYVEVRGRGERERWWVEEVRGSGLYGFTLVTI